MIRKTIGLFFISTCISMMIYGCCEDVYTVSSDFEVSFIQSPSGDEIFILEDTIKGAFKYVLQAEIIAQINSLKDFSLISSAYAFQCEESYENGYIKETAIVTLDKPFQLDGEIILPGTNLLELDKDFSGNEYNTTTEEYNVHVNENGINIHFKEEFIERVVFPLSAYKFKTVVKMKDGTEIVSEEIVNIKIN